MDLFILNVDEGGLEQIHKPDFAAEKRVVYSEKRVNEAIFRSNEVVSLRKVRVSIVLSMHMRSSK